MEQKYWLGRKHQSKAMARHATSSEARLIHLHLAGCYSVKAATCDARLEVFAAGEEPALSKRAIPADGERR